MPDDSGQAGEAGGTLGRKVAGVPMWAWGVAAGLGAGVVFLIIRGRSSSAADSGVPASSQPNYGSPDQTTIVPVNQGLGDQQAADILSAIQGINGPASTTATATKPTITTWHKGQTYNDFVAQAKQSFGVNLTWAQFLKLNPGIVAAQLTPAGKGAGAGGKRKAKQNILVRVT